MEQEKLAREAGGSLGRICSEFQLSRRAFVRALGAVSAAGMLGSVKALAAAGNAYFVVVNHWHQCGVGWFFREGVVGDKRYQHAFSIFYGIQQSIEAMRRNPSVVTCLEFDSHAFEAIQEEDPQFVREVLNPLVASGRIDVVGGSYAQPYGQLIGWQANVRQFVEGRKTGREILHKEIDTFLSEELSFHPQMPQLLKLCGFKSASLQVENNGSLPTIDKAIINWQGLDKSTIPTIPTNPWMIIIDKQYKSLAPYLDQQAKEQGALLMIWHEIWPPGVDWGSSYMPFDEGFQSLEHEGATSIGLSEYLNRRIKEPIADTKYFAMEDAGSTFGWPEDKGLLWEHIGGWGYEGDALLKENRRVEHQMHAAELLLSLAPDAQRAGKMDSLWKKLMMTQNHDCLIVSGYPAAYQNILATNLQVTKALIAEIDVELLKLRTAVLEKMAKAAGSGKSVEVVCQNTSSVSVRQPVVVEFAAEEAAGYALECGDEKVELQRIAPPYANSPATWVGVAELPSCGMKAYSLRKSTAQPAKPVSTATNISNKYYSVEWDAARKGFSILDREKNRSILFRPFTGDITHLNETFWASPNVNEKFRAKNFGEVSYASKVESVGPVYQAISIRGDILTQNTTDEPAAWASARVVLYEGLKRIDFFAELYTNPQMGFLTLAEFELAQDGFKASCDFPFGEEEARKEQFPALSYVRLHTPEFAVVLAHGGTQQFFIEKKAGSTLLKNMIGRETMKGSYQWQWSMTTGTSFTPEQSYRFAEGFRAPVVQKHSGQIARSYSWLATSNPALVVFRLNAASDKVTIWLMNYSGAASSGKLLLADAVKSCRRVDFEGRVLEGKKAILSGSGKQIELELLPWEMASLELTRV